MSGAETFKIPTYEFYQDEGNYVSPEEIDDVAISRIKSRKIGAKTFLSV